MIVKTSHDDLKIW